TPWSFSRRPELSGSGDADGRNGRHRGPTMEEDKILQRRGNSRMKTLLFAVLFMTVLIGLPCYAAAQAYTAKQDYAAKIEISITRSSVRVTGTVQYPATKAAVAALVEKVLGRPA